MTIVREIKYFDYMENESKLGNAGHVKIEWWDGLDDGRQHREGFLQLRVNHLPVEYIPLGGQGEETAEIILHTALGQEVLGNMKIEKGMGNFDCSIQLLLDLLGEKLSYEDVWSICIPLGGNRQVVCRIHEPKIAENAEDLPKGRWDTEVAEREEVLEETMVLEETVVDTGISEEEGSKENEEKEPVLISVPSSEDKWGHLCTVYPKITPFSDSREYLKIGPNDFVLLNAKYYSLIHNSFMLHGYYQYGQLVLCRVMRRGKALYYLGTPGTYLEREKQVALMYGFQSFECDSEPAAEGDFGYYMIQVEL